MELCLDSTDIDYRILKVLGVCSAATLEEESLFLRLIRYIHCLFGQKTQSVVNYVKSRLFLRNHEHTLVLSHCIGNDVNYRLRLTCTGRAVDDHVTAFLYLSHYLGLSVVEHLHGI